MDCEEKLEGLLAQSAQQHAHLCPRQVLGVRIGLYAGVILGLDLPQKDKRLFAFAESDGCGTGGISIATGCCVDRRTMRIIDYGKLAATFVDTMTNKAVRISPRSDCREAAAQHHFSDQDTWRNQLVAYQKLPYESLLKVQEVALTVSLEKIISQAGLRVVCSKCCEEIMNEREVRLNGQVYCRSCAEEGYYTLRQEYADQPVDYPFLEPLMPGLARRNQKVIPAITVIGKSGAGKTTLLEKLIRKLSDRGYRLATIKHHGHHGFEIDVPGKDSWRFAQAGSTQVILTSPDQWAAYRKLDAEIPLDDLIAGIHEVDLILVEGYKQANKPSIVVLRAENSKELIGGVDQRIAVAADFPIDLDIPCFHLDDVDGLTEFIENSFLNS